MPPGSTYAPPPEHETDCHNNIGEHIHTIYIAHHNDDKRYMSAQKQRPQEAAEEPMYTAVSVSSRSSQFAHVRRRASYCPAPEDTIRS